MLVNSQKINSAMMLLVSTSPSIEAMNRNNIP